MVKYAIRQRSSHMIYMAGLYRIEHGTEPVFTILTREPAQNIAFIHDRMPVILSEDATCDWLNLRYKADEVLDTVDNSQINVLTQRTMHRICTAAHE